MEAATLLTEARRRAGLSRRALARRGATSPSTLAAYEAGASVPSVATLSRLLRAAGFEAEVALRRVGDTDDRQRAAAIEALLAFTDQMPRERRGPLDAPVFGYQRSGGRR